MTTPIEPQPEATPAANKTELLIAFLKDRDAFCPACKYNLRNITAPQSNWLQSKPRCPECGREIELTVGVTEPYLVPWALTTVFVAMAATIGILVIVGTFMAGPPPLTRLPVFGCLSILYGLAAIPLTLTMVATRSRFVKLQHSTQVFIALIAFTINAVLLLGCIITVH